MMTIMDKYFITMDIEIKAESKAIAIWMAENSALRNPLVSKALVQVISSNKEKVIKGSGILKYYE